MSVLGKVKGFFSGKKDRMHGGIDKAAGAARGKVSENHAEKVDKVQEAADKAVDKLAGEGEEGTGDSGETKS